MANATATKPDKTPTAKKAPKQPPADTIWLRYHPWMEGIVGHIASWAIHALVIGVVLLFVLAYALGWIKTNKQIPTEAVTFVNDGGGGGNPSGSGDDRGGKAPLKEGVQANNNNAGNTTNPNTQNDRPDLTAVTKPNDPTFAPPHYVNADPEALKSIRGLDEVLSGKDFNPSKGVGGTGTGTGEGPGTGPGVGPGTGPARRGAHPQDGERGATAALEEHLDHDGAARRRLSVQASDERHHSRRPGRPLQPQRPGPRAVHYHRPVQARLTDGGRQGGPRSAPPRDSGGTSPNPTTFKTSQVPSVSKSGRR